MTEPVGIDVQAVRRRAHELWLKRGCPTGTPELDWSQAERELRAEGARAETRPATVSGAASLASPPSVPRPRPPRSIVMRASHAPAARLLAALVPEASPDGGAAPIDRAASRR